MSRVVYQHGNNRVQKLHELTCRCPSTSRFLSKTRQSSAWLWCRIERRRLSGGSVSVSSNAHRSQWSDREEKFKKKLPWIRAYLFSEVHLWHLRIFQRFPLVEIVLIAARVLLVGVSFRLEFRNDLPLLVQFLGRLARKWRNEDLLRREDLRNIVQAFRFSHLRARKGFQGWQDAQRTRRPTPRVSTPWTDVNPSAWTNVLIIPSIAFVITD